MSKRKKFGVAADITRAMADVVNAVDNNSGQYRNEVIALMRIEIDPENSRELTLLPNDLINGINPSDVDSEKKKAEKASLESLAHTIQEQGVINPIVLYKYGEKYRLIAGERRFLSSILAKKADIPAKVINEKPSLLKIRALQWIENNEREDLSLRERIKNIKQIVEAHEKENPREKITIEVLRKQTGLSRGQAGSYLMVINGPADVLKGIEQGAVNSLDKATLIAGLKEASARQQALAECAKGQSLAGLKKAVLLERDLKKKVIVAGKAKAGRALSHVNLGKVKNIQTIKKLIDTVIAHPNYQRYGEHFKKTDWNRHDHASDSFKRLIEIIEKGL